MCGCEVSKDSWQEVRYLTPLLFWIAPRIFPDKIGWLRSLPIALVLGIITAVTVDLIDHILWNALVSSNMTRPVSIQFVLDNFHFLNEFFIYGAVLLAGFSRAYFFRFQEHQKEAIQLRMDAARLQAHLAEARLRSLRMQINPHFLFNTLHIISDHFEENPRAARRMIARLSEILRYTLEGTETREITFKQELEFLDGYFDIQRFRFEDRLEIKTNISPEVLNALLPTLILQPLVENAIKHGVNQIEGQGVISIESWREDEELHIQIADNGPGLVALKEEKPKGIGIRNSSERLQMLYGENHKFTTESPPAGGFIVSIVLPFHTNSDYFLSSKE